MKSINTLPAGKACPPTPHPSPPGEGGGNSEADDKASPLLFVMAGLGPAICKPLIWLDPRHKAEDDDGEAEGLSAVR